MSRVVRESHTIELSLAVYRRERERKVCGRWDLDPGYQLGGLVSSWHVYGRKTRLDDDRTTFEPLASAFNC